MESSGIVLFGWVDYSKNCTLDATRSRRKQVIILHARNKNEFVLNALLFSAKNINQSSGDYHEDMSAGLFETWFVEHLLPNISLNSVIVIDDASYQTRQLTKIPNTNTNKAAITFTCSKKIKQISTTDHLTK